MISRFIPSSYRRGSSPPLPLIISPHGRGLSGRVNAANWGNLPARGGFAVVNPDSRGRKLSGLAPDARWVFFSLTEAPQ